jgi:RNA polymerase sigma factor for flagellar operon FliA
MSVADLVRDNSISAAERLESAEYKRLLATAIDRLPQRERQVIALYYVEELTMKEIGEVIGVTESRVSQLRTQAIIRMRGQLPK